MRRCPNGHEVSDDIKFCPQCGDEIQDNVAEEIRFCKKCGSERRGTEKYCSQCGTPFYGSLDVNQDNPHIRQNSYGSNYNKLLLFFLIILTILIGGYIAYNHIQEEKRLKKERIEEQERTAKEKRRQIEEEEKRKEEEENSPTKRLYKIATQGNNVFWAASFSKQYIPSTTSENKKNLFTIGFFLRPISENSGKLSYVEMEELNFDTFFGAKNLYAVYTITDNILQATLQGDYVGTFLKKDHVISLRIENDGDNIQLIEMSQMNNRVFKQGAPVTQKGMRFVDPKEGDLHSIMKKLFNN